MYRILILSSAAIAFSGCSLNNNGSNYGHGGSAHQQSSSYGYNNCGAGNCAPGNSYSVADNYAQQGGYGAHQDHAYGAPQQPSAHAYGSQVQGQHGQRGYQGYGQAPQLRGAYGNRGHRGYKYGTLGIVNYDAGDDLYGIQGRFGYQGTKYFGAEAEGSFGIISDKQDIGTAELKASVDYSLAAFARGVVPVGQRLNVFGRLGYHVTEIGGSLTDPTSTVETSVSTDGFAYGAGVEYAINPRDAIRLDYTRYDLGPGETDSLALAYSRKF